MSENAIDALHSPTRMEHDSLGDLAVPAKALWGAQTQRAVENYPISGLHAHPALIRATMLVKKAAALTNRDTGRLDKRLADAIVAAADEVLDGRWRDQFVVDV
ncbi:MAG TPA: lyase family protein, partial [Ktedonobacterales bacterium]|nr:lyase family protein [Ktedonobacterales bacterium]